MKIIGEIGEAIRAVQTTYGVELHEIEFRSEHREEILHVVLHETCHAAISLAAPWIHTLPAAQHTAVDEIAAHVLEAEMSEQLSLNAPSVEAHARELSRYGLTLSVDALRGFFSVWAAISHTQAGIEQLCQHIHETLFENS